MNRGGGEVVVFESFEEVLITIHFIDMEQSMEHAIGISWWCSYCKAAMLLVRDEAGVKLDEEIQWPLVRDEAGVKLDELHYFLTLRIPAKHGGESSSDNLLNYGLTIAAKGQEGKTRELDSVQKKFSAFRRWIGPIYRATRITCDGIWPNTKAQPLNPSIEFGHKGRLFN